MYGIQKQIEFFWPLTEQIPLDLDYNNCEKPKLTVECNTGMNFVAYPTNVSYGTIGAMHIKATELTVQVTHMPWYRKLAYKLMGFKWE
jgi:hypothetical protein